jgi:hypothetical protein
MSGWRQTQYEQAGSRVSESRQRPPPILIRCKRRAALARHLLAPGHQPRTTLTVADLLGELRQLDRALRLHGASSSIAAKMPLWLWIVMLLMLLKLPLFGLMLWIPFRYDESMSVSTPDVPDSSEEDGGSRALPGSPLDPHPRTPLPRTPRRGPHGSPSPAPPLRVRTSVRSTRRVSVSH